MCTNPRKPRHRGLYIRYSLAPVPPLGYRWTVFDISTVSIKPQYLTFEKMAVLRRLTYCMMFHQLFIIPGCNTLLLGTLSTIASLIFREFVLELGGPASHPQGWSQESRGLWRNVDNIFAEEFVRHGGFRLIIRTSDLSHWEDLRGRAGWGFPLLTGSGCIYCEWTSRTLVLAFVYLYLIRENMDPAYYPRRTQSVSHAGWSLTESWQFPSIQKWPTSSSERR